MRQIYNVAPFALIVNIRERAIQPCGSTFVEDDVARELTNGPDWSFEDPRRRPARYDKLVIRHPVDPAVEMVSEGSPNL